MRKPHIAALLLTLVLCLTLAACQTKEQPSPTPDNTENTTLAEDNKSSNTPETGAENTNTDTGKGNSTNKTPTPNAPVDDGTTAAERHLLEMGYPLGFTIRFAANGRGFDTGTGQLFDGADTTAYDLTEKLRTLYMDMTEANIYGVARDLTYRTLSGGGVPGDDNITYTLTFTDDGTVYTFAIDSAAMEAYDTSDVSNLGSLVRQFAGLTDLCYQNLSK